MKRVEKKTPNTKQKWREEDEERERVEKRNQRTTKDTRDILCNIGAPNPTSV